MKNDARNEVLMTRYLLGELPEAEQLRLEEQFFTDEEFSERLLALESELKYDYARGALTPQARAQFERRFLVTDEDRQEVEFAGAVMSKIAEVAEAEKPQLIADEGESRAWLRSLLAFLTLHNPAMRVSFAAAGLVVALGLLWLIFETVRLRDQLEQAQAQRAAQEQRLRQQATDERERREQLSGELELERNRRAKLEQDLAGQKAASSSPAGQATGSSILSFVLMPGRVRDEKPKRLLVPPNADTLRLQLDLKKRSRHQKYRAALLTDDGEELWSQDLPRARRTASGQGVTLRLPARLLAEGDYELKLKGLTASREFEDVGDYYFTIVKK